MLLDEIRANNELSKLIRNSCSENGISLQVSTSVNPNDIVILKVDDFYNANVKNPPPSPDCLIIQRCQNGYNIYISELRDINSPQGFSVDHITQKFTTCIEDFMSHRFGDIFHKHMGVRQVKLYFIADPYNFKNNPAKQSRSRGLKIDTLMAQRIPRLFGFYLYIEPKVPNPTITPC